MLTPTLIIIMRRYKNTLLTNIFTNSVQDIDDVGETTGDKDVQNFDDSIYSLVSNKEAQSHDLEQMRKMLFK